MPTLYLIDGYAQFFRSYHAIRTPMTSPVTKEPTNLTFGFVGMMLKLLRANADFNHDYVAVALDVSDDRGTFRSQIYPDYKAHRPPPPEDLKPQVRRCIELLRTVGVPLLGEAGFEADDVIATVVTQLRAKHPDLRIRIASKDKDLKQLLFGETVELFDIQTDTPYSEATLLNDTGLKPQQVIDMLALMGDNADNVPGVDGIGDKTAAMLIKEYGSLDALIAQASAIKGKRGENIRAATDQLSLSKRLVTLEHNVPVSFTLEDAAIKSKQWSKLIPVFKELGFNRYQDDLKTILGEPITAAAQPMPPVGIPVPRKKSEPAPDPMQGGLFDAAPAAAAASTREVNGAYTCITTLAQLKDLAKQLVTAPIIAIDTETTALSPHDAKLCGISISIEPGTGYYIPTLSPTPSDHLTTAQVLDTLRPILEDASRPKCGHNLKFDILIFRGHGVALRGVVCDTMVGSYLIDASRSSHGLDSLALALLGRTNISISELIGSGKNQRTFDTVPLALATDYAAEDADVALQLYNIMMPQLREMGMQKLLDDVEIPLVTVLAELEWNGIIVEPAELDRQRERLQLKITEIVNALNAESKAALGRTFDPDSPKQLAAALFNKDEDEPNGLGIKGTKKTKTGFSTDAEVLESLAEDDTLGTNIPKLVLEYRQLSKLVSTYLVALKEAIHPKTGRVHASFHQTVAATGRLASSDPNLQNIPIRTEVGREIRRAFVAPAGCSLLSADYSQIELRLLAHLSRDPALIDAFMQDQDIHTAVAAQIHGVPLSEVTRDQRSGAKMVNFGIVYGITAFGLARRLKIENGAAAAIIDGYRRRFAGITTFLQECVEQARTHGYVCTMLGRRRPIPEIDSNNPSRRALAERLAINTVVQGSAADLIKLAMVNLHRRFTTGPEAGPEGGWNCKMLLQIHDELVFECPDERVKEAGQIVTREMESAMHLLVPLKADSHASKTWFDGK
jgi:DNA polymerase-1